MGAFELLFFFAKEQESCVFVFNVQNIKKDSRPATLSFIVAGLLSFKGILQLILGKF